MTDALASSTAALPTVRLNKVGKRFPLENGELEAIRDFTLDIREGESIAILGSSGCGKSTLLRLLIGLDETFDGQILIDGQPVRGIGSERGIVFQEHRLFPWLNVAQNVDLGLVNENLPPEQRRRRVEEFIRLVELDGFQRAYPHQLSGGMAQRVAIARGLVASPRILLLDEPFAALDALTRQQMQEELQAIRARSGITSLLVTHDVEEAIFIADRVVVMAPRPGRIKRIVEIGLPHPRDRAGYDFHRLRQELLSELTGGSSNDRRQPRR
ncbi:ABC transporter, ATP-binding component [Azotobacter vinelandii CA]|uniref:ABC transporter, ATP-binding component n=2 Tax=Azotobacter vinelandii TaxID=354 RepID=C1DMM4_AZOVD|nr:ABC transporter ATP-binding protein [Azotobacter vinelandii]ACO77054.1 ABC transporter, ATP-binding component [Azotobacter vinelandii DJ]AGK17182.1 ABC transporter, ATP-binding component [Azotobacter vinelandii CA]AGK19529.1 ABC transporter, ATP-binding component [Azotobacter vinelandii CA6]SFY27305.1 sulfonate transport system ATP-binding protein [Azotobacter vinelandii]GLK61043.1 ABC transporter ATP-binding protein [Azotobacter vinelandii]